MADFQLGIIVGILIYTLLISLIAVVTEDDESIIVFAIGAGWLLYGLAVICTKVLKRFKKFKKRLDRKREEKRLRSRDIDDIFLEDLN